LIFLVAALGGVGWFVWSRSRDGRHVGGSSRDD
jgi:hypothetical protein